MWATARLCLCHHGAGFARPLVTSLLGGRHAASQGVMPSMRRTADQRKITMPAISPPDLQRRLAHREALHGGTVLPRHHRQAYSSRYLRQLGRTRVGNRAIHRAAQRRSQTTHLDVSASNILAKVTRAKAALAAVSRLVQSRVAHYTRTSILEELRLDGPLTVLLLHRL